MQAGRDFLFKVNAEEFYRFVFFYRHVMLLNEQNVNILSKLIEESQQNEGNAMRHRNGIETSVIFVNRKQKGAHCVTSMRVLGIMRAPNETWYERCLRCYNTSMSVEHLLFLFFFFSYCDMRRGHNVEEFFELFSHSFAILLLMHFPATSV